MNVTRKFIALTLSIILTLSLAACGSGNSNSGANASGTSITIAYQGGIGYAPVHVMETKKLIEKHYGEDITVNFVKLDSGAAINEGIIGGTIDIGCMGVAPAISGVAAGIPYKAISNLCSQSHGLTSNDPSITKLSDITSEDKIALVNTGSIQHILLAMGAEKELGDAHALDHNIQAMSHAEGMAALESGTVTLHLTSSPFIYQERENANYNELSVISEVWPSGNSFLVAMASNKIEQNEKLYNAVSAAFAEAIDFINNNLDETVAIESQYLSLNEATVLSYLSEDDCQYFSDVRGAETMMSFMHRAGFIENEVTIDKFLFDGVEGN